MPHSDPHAQSMKEHKKRQQLFMLFLVCALAFFFYLRLRVTPRYDDDAFKQLYDELCEDLQAGRNAESILPAAKKQVRRAGVNMEVLFYYQYISVLAGTMPAPDAFSAVEPPIRDAVNRGDFATARTLLQRAVFQDDAMNAGRGDAWMTFIRELEVRWNNDCKPPSTHAP